MTRQNTKHGHATRDGQSAEYNSWRGMIERCENTKHVGYPYYGARGITVCERWRNSFSAFLADMGLKPSSRHTIDRIQTDGNYDPNNCQWATPAEQRANQRKYDERARVQASWDSGARSRISRSRIDLTGQKFWRLLVTGYADTMDGRARWACLCDCGAEATVAGKALRTSATKSCGCLSREASKERAIIRNKLNNPARRRR